MDPGTVADQGTADDRTRLEIETETETDGEIMIGLGTAIGIVGPTAEVIAVIGGPTIPGVRLALEESRSPKEMDRPPGRTLEVSPRSRGWPWQREKAEMVLTARLQLRRARASIMVAHGPS